MGQEFWSHGLEAKERAQESEALQVVRETEEVLRSWESEAFQKSEECLWESEDNRKVQAVVRLESGVM